MKNYKSYTPTKRHVILTDKSSLWKGSPEKNMIRDIHSMQLISFWNIAI